MPFVDELKRVHKASAVQSSVDARLTTLPQITGALVVMKSLRQNLHFDWMTSCSTSYQRGMRGITSSSLVSLQMREGGYA
jgi:hypothetical protein